MYLAQFILMFCPLFAASFPYCAPLPPSVVMAPPPTHSLPFGEDVCDAAPRPSKWPSIVATPHDASKTAGLHLWRSMLPSIGDMHAYAPARLLQARCRRTPPKAKMAYGAGTRKCIWLLVASMLWIAHWFLPTIQIGCHIQVVDLCGTRLWLPAGL